MIGCSYLNIERVGELAAAVFLDRDGTVSEYSDYITRPDQLRIPEGTAECLRDFTDAGYHCVVVSNQSAVGRGMMTEEQLRRVHVQFLDMLRARGALLSAIYYCPDLPETDDEFTVANPDRKPGAAMLQRAAKDLQLDLTSSWMIGDRYSDVLAGQNAGCRCSIRVRSGYQYTPGMPRTTVAPHITVDDLPAAAEYILSGECR